MQGSAVFQCADCGVMAPAGSAVSHKPGCRHERTARMFGVKQAALGLAIALATLEAYEEDYGEPLPPTHELGRIEESRGMPSFRIRAGHIRQWAAALIPPSSEGGEEKTDPMFFVRKVYDTFKRDMEQGYVTKDKQFAVDLLGKALHPPAVASGGSPR